ncbi:MAG: aminoacyl-tRNA hydrolase [Candidatus Azambacteria bacterium]|nr:aminoacyl-tRNA hydrolase [Candidatus Azambacteria bacterium]
MNKINIKLIVGLGNPGKEYEKTRHNIGLLFIDELSKQSNAPDFKYEKSPTFMNKSGIAVSTLSKSLKIKPENILIVHDDIDILWGNFKLSFGRSSAGHKGVESIIKTLKTKNFWRLRIGIQPVRQAQGKPKKHISADKIILKKFTPSELKTLNQTIKRAIYAISSS